MTEFSEICAGQELPPLHFTMDLRSMVKYAAATWDFHRFHYDDTFVRSVGMPAPFVDGQMFGALLSRMLMSWAGPDAFLRRLGYRQDATVYVDETVVITGRVRATAVEEGTPVVDLDLAIEKDDGTPVVRHAAARVQLAASGTGTEHAGTSHADAS